MTSSLTARPDDPRLGPLVPAIGVPIQTEQRADLGTQILFSTHVQAPGRYLRRGFTVTHTIGRTTYRDFITAEITVVNVG